MTKAFRKFQKLDSLQFPKSERNNLSHDKWLGFERFKTGKLYKCTSHHLIIFPTREIASKALDYLPIAQDLPESCSTQYLKIRTAELNELFCLHENNLSVKIYYARPHEAFLAISKSTHFNNDLSLIDIFFLQVLFGEKRGWIIFDSRKSMGIGI